MTPSLRPNISPSSPPSLPQARLRNLPSTAELPCSDDAPVDNELQNLLPNLLLTLLTHLWSARMDWYFGVDMAVYHETGTNVRVPVVPDGFLSLNVERLKGGQRRRSYATWEEDGVVPILVLETVSHQPGGEYEGKMATYANLGVLYYIVYNREFWRRDKHQPFEVYKLTNDQYELQAGEPYWMPEIGLGIGRWQTVIGGIDEEILTWFDADGQRHLGKDEQEYQRAEQERERFNQEQARANSEQQRADLREQQAAQERERAEKLAAQLRALGIEPEG
jgi:Uma2 family endonuclease